VTKPELIYAHARNLTTGFTHLLIVPLNVCLQAKCSRPIRNRCRWIHFGEIFTTGSS